MLNSKIACLLLAGFLLLPTISVAGESTPSHFSDTSGHWASDVIQWAVENELVAGYSDHTFRPDEPITEAQFVAILLRSFHEDTETNEGPLWSAPYYRVAKKYNMPLSGADELKNRERAINRTRIAEIICGIDGKHYDGQDAIRYALQNGYAQGKISPKYSGLTVYSYRGEEYLTRAEALTVIKQLHDKGLNKIKSRPDTLSDPTKLSILEGEKLAAYQSDQGTSGPVLYFTYEVDNGTVYFTNNQVNPKDPSYRVRLKEDFNPLINLQVYAIANSLYDPEHEELNLSYSRKGYSSVSIKFGTYDMKLQSTPSPYFGIPFEYEIFDEPGNSRDTTIELWIDRLWGNGKQPAQLEDYYILKLRSSLISFLGENDGNKLCDALVEEFKVLIQDQAKVKDWQLEMGDPAIDYSRSAHFSLKDFDVYIYTSISHIQVNFNPKAKVPM